MSDVLIRSLLDYWIGPRPPTPDSVRAQLPTWFGGSRDVDFDIERRFGKLVSLARSGALDHWADSADGALALALLLDQFPRNLFRGSAQAFASDDKARQIARQAIDRGDLQTLHPVEALFLLLPLEHSESLDDQRECLRLCRDLYGKIDAPWRQLTSGFIDYAERHLELIEQFGRFPHRNELLGRESTDAERAWLESTGERFGQR